MGGTSKSIRKGVKKNFRIFKTLNTPFSVSFLFRFASFLVVTVLPTLSLSLSLSQKRRNASGGRVFDFVFSFFLEEFTLYAEEAFL